MNPPTNPARPLQALKGIKRMAFPTAVMATRARGRTPRLAPLSSNSRHQGRQAIIARRGRCRCFVIALINVNRILVFGGKVRGGGREGGSRLRRYVELPIPRVMFFFRGGVLESCFMLVVVGCDQEREAAREVPLAFPSLVCGPDLPPHKRKLRVLLCVRSFGFPFRWRAMPTMHLAPTRGRPPWV